ncbi:FAD-dependent oxidoreductase [Pelagicoccus sp. SDUM812005]|uniref:FAD-dependent oxidoreductase n=1 Tax=Pelagicoccus sp. SDUM812005 TaxID=3041257 RepID=UPI00280F7A03|nr:FAD-dependent oxidoreductase [Pelagicoccus sp. SDUM812005]MDQ8180341.1 FAD-dependent oxidoreductase [Pelagicoccus sp. SDUM812005]
MNQNVNVIDLGDRSPDQWLQMGTGENQTPQRRKRITTDVAVIGGGMAGICAAVSAARNGAKVVLVQDRSVLGGNASSEIRVIVHGVTKLTNGLADRETGIIEEILLHNRFMNPQESFTVWDHVLYDFVVREPNITLLFDTQAIKANMDGDRIASARCWQGPTETEITIEAKQFIDCSGDGLLAATSGAEYRSGREARSEFNEKFAPEKADGWTLGATILLSSDDKGKPMPFKAPSFAIPYEGDAKYSNKGHDDRSIIPFQEGFWWVEVGSDFDIVGDFDTIRHKLMGYAYGVWDYVKNSGKYPEADNYALGWVGSVPGRRESRRFIGDHILCESDLLEHRHFEDAVAFGGWPLDEHNPGGIENLQDPPSFWHSHFDKVYEIPYRSLYSKNVSNLQFAGRNVSVTHVALSSTRVMGTCATMGQAVGTAAALCIAKGISPRELAIQHIHTLQEQLLRDDAYIPNRPASRPGDLAQQAKQITASSTSSGDPKLLLDGVPRDEHGEVHHWASDGHAATLNLEWDEPVGLSEVHLKCDSNLQRNIMMLKTPRDTENYAPAIPQELLKSAKVLAFQNGDWKKVASVEHNQARLVRFRFSKIRTPAIRIHLKDTYGSSNIKLFEVRCYN